MASGINFPTSSLRSQEEASRVMISTIFFLICLIWLLCAYAVFLICRQHPGVSTALHSHVSTGMPLQAIKPKAAPWRQNKPALSCQYSHAPAGNIARGTAGTRNKDTAYHWGMVSSEVRHPII